MTAIGKCEIILAVDAGVAQQVEQLICNQQVRGSNPFTSLAVTIGYGFFITLKTRKTAGQGMIEKTKSTKWALITGASGSLGRELALLLAQENYSLILHYQSNISACFKLLEDCQSISGKSADNYLLWQADFSDPAQLEPALASVLKKIPYLNVLINNAAVDSYEMVNDIEWQSLQKLLQVNIAAPILLTKGCLPQLKAAAAVSAAQIINISSIWGIYGAAMETAYAASKGAINALTKSLAKELYDFPIRVNAIAPGLFTSKMNDRFTNTEITAFVKEHSLLQRAADAREIAQTALFLLSDRATYINGQILEVSGAYI